MRKRRAREGRADEIEHLPVPSRVTARNRSSVSIIEHKDSMVTVKPQTFKLLQKEVYVEDSTTLGQSLWM